GKVLRDLASDRAYRWLRFSPDGCTLAAADADSLRLVNVADGKDIRTWTKLPDPVLRVAFSPDGKIMADYDDDNDMQIREVKSGKLLWSRTHQYGDHNNPFTPVLFYPDGKTLAFAQASRIQLFDPDTGTRRRPP